MKLIAALTAAALGAASFACSATSSACEDAALAQALAEQAWGNAIEAHEAAHHAEEDGEAVDHDEHERTARQIVDARIIMIVAEQNTRNSC